MDYSVLMSVYNREKPKYLAQAMESIASQTIPTDDFVLVCDGPLNDGLEQVIADGKKLFGDALHLVRLEKNGGLGNALNTGIKFCRHDLVARMDSDDISLPGRCEKQLAAFENDPSLSVLSGTVLEFKDSPEYVSGKRELPQKHEEILAFSYKRNPFNHPAVMFQKSAVAAAGGYDESYPLFEDYYLWIRMLQNGCKGYNLKEPLLYMRTPEDLYLRRGGKKYAKDMLRFHKWLLRSGFTKPLQFLTGAVPHALVCVLPNRVRRAVYKGLRARC